MIADLIDSAASTRPARAALALIWRASPRRVRRRADALVGAAGEAALLRSRERAWAARAAGRDAKARFWEAVGAEVERRLRRARLVADLLAPPASPRARRPAQVLVLPARSRGRAA
jgi:hypothetical protein